MNPQLMAAALMRGQAAQTPQPTMLSARPPVALPPAALAGSSAPQSWNTTPQGREAQQVGLGALAHDLAAREQSMHPPGDARLQALLREQQRAREMGHLMRAPDARGRRT